MKIIGIPKTPPARSIMKSISLRKYDKNPRTVTITTLSPRLDVKLDPILVIVAIQDFRGLKLIPVFTNRHINRRYLPIVIR
jgi:hypothetical protein